MEDQPLEEGQEVGGSSVDISLESHDNRQKTGSGGGLWNPNDEHYYGADSSSVRTDGSSSGRWRYPANFEDAAPEVPRKKSGKKKEKKDRWARTEDAYSIEENGGSRKKSKKSKKKKSTVDDSDTYSRRSDSTNEFPEDAGGGLYGDRTAPQTSNGREDDDNVFNHEF